MAAILAGACVKPAAAADTWRFGVVDAKGEAGIFYMPTKFGAKYGIDIQMMSFASSTTPVKALISNDLDVFTSAPAVALIAMSRGAKIKFVGCTLPGPGYMLYSAKDITSLAQLKGKNIAVSGPGSMPDLYAREVLHQNGIPENEVNFVNSGGGTDRYKALVAGVVQATATTGEFAPEAKKHGYHILASAHDTMPNFLRDCLVVADQTIADRRQGLAHFLAANMDGMRYVTTHRKETIELAHKVAHLPVGNTGPAVIYDEAAAEKAVDPTLAVPVKKLQWIEDMLVRQHVLSKSHDVTAFVDEGPRQEAQKLLKP
ncbi:MAG TPA: ABC transporter substrate-binding protein [Stellaceae bacterium]|jgi:NitT/TauT family transport system substrate-binding protein|nr:ABC transporter substrate-binding protein [Stellaceae bacterium]